MGVVEVEWVEMEWVEMEASEVKRLVAWVEVVAAECAALSN